jgi:hypothetical protein
MNPRKLDNSVLSEHSKLSFKAQAFSRHLEGKDRLETRDETPILAYSPLRLRISLKMEY